MGPTTEMYLIIVGAGDIGRPLIDIASRGGNDVVVVEQDEVRAEEIAASYDCLVIRADATVHETLIDAGADRADAVIATTDRDATNVMVSLLAQEFEIPNIVSVVHNPEHMKVFEQIGVNTMENPQRLIAEHLYRAVQRPSIVDFLTLGDSAEVFEIVVDDGAPIVGYTVKEAAEDGLLGDDILLVAVERNGDERPITPRGNTRIDAGDVLTVYSGTGATDEVTRAFRTPTERT